MFVSTHDKFSETICDVVNIIDIIPIPGWESLMVVWVARASSYLPDRPAVSLIIFNVGGRKTYIKL